MIGRRKLLQGMAGTAAANLLAPSLTFAALSRSRLLGDRRLVVFVLRGGLDGLAAVPPHGDPNYARLRGNLALPMPSDNVGEGGILNLDGFFGLHPALAAFHELYGQGELLPLQAVAPPYQGRSHFDGQDVLENGTTTALGRSDGWLNRALAHLQTPGNEENLGLAVGEGVPLILRGDRKVASWSPDPLPEAAPDFLRQVATLWQNDSLLGPALGEGIKARDMSSDTMGGNSNASGNKRNAWAAENLARKAGALLATANGPRIAVLEAGGWDTHANQGAAKGQLANHLKGLSESVLALKQSLGAAWQTTAVIAVTEFGRTAAPNGTGGTDHGVGGAAFLLGGAVAGGRVVTDWPGLAQANLYQGRDLRPTLDLRALFKAVLQDHLGLASSAIESDVFPDSRAIKPLRDLFRV